MTSRSSPASLESEAALLVVSRSPERTIRRLGALRHAGKFELRPRGVETIRDTYLDTPDGRLGAKRIALRTRETERGTLVTLKATGRARGGVSSRSELELPLNSTNAGRVLRALTRLGIEGEMPSARELVARRWLASGSMLVPSQVRTTRRMLRDVFRLGGASRRRVAEMAVDRVLYSFTGARVSLEEVEVEAKDKGTARDVRDFVGALQALFKGELRPWEHSKLATGKALEERHRSGRLASLVTSTRRLKTTGVSALSRQLRRD